MHIIQKKYITNKGCSQILNAVHIRRKKDVRKRGPLFSRTYSYNAFKTFVKKIK